MIRTNEKWLIEAAVQVEVHPYHNPDALAVGHDGVPFNLPTSGAIVYNVRTGDPAFGWAADHVEPGATTRSSDQNENLALQNLVCIGNTATVVSGDAKGDRGVVVGKHGGSDHTLISFSAATLDKLIYGDKILIRTHGKGLVLEDFPNVRTLCLSPRLLGVMGLREHGGKLICPVAVRVPAHLMGSGINGPSERGDYDIMASDAQAIEDHGLAGLRLGDLVAIMDHDNRFGRSYRRGAVSIGVVVHGTSRLSSHGPGVTVLFTSAGPDIEPSVEPGANLADLLSLGR